MSLSDPFEVFESWYALAQDCQEIKHPTAFCLSTVSAEGAAEGRLLDLRHYDHSGFCFATQSTSRKAMSISHNAMVALTFWWDPLDRQVRVQGLAAVLDKEESQELFAALPRASQLLFWASEQGGELRSFADLQGRFEGLRRRFETSEEIPLAERWIAYKVRPERFEFLHLSPDRIHRRICYQLASDRWLASYLQP